MDAYRKGLTAKQAEYAVRKYKRHRVIPFKGRGKSRDF